MPLQSLYPATATACATLPSLNDFGYLPAGIYEIDLRQVEAMFVAKNPVRIKHFQNLTRSLEDLKNNGTSGFCYIDGSFISNKHAPSDIDVVLEIPNKDSNYFSQLKKSKSWPQCRSLIFNPQFVRENYALDYYFWQPVMQTGGENDLIQLFQRIKPRDAIIRNLPPTYRKGIIRLTV